MHALWIKWGILKHVDYLRNTKNSTGAKTKLMFWSLWQDKFFFENWPGYSAEIPCGSKMSSKSLYLAQFSRYQHFYILQFLQKIQNDRHFWRDKFFLKIGIATLQRYPVDRNLVEIALSSTVFKI